MAFFKSSAAVDNAATSNNGDFVKIKQGASVRVRQLPPTTADLKTIYRQVVHFKLKDPNKDGDKNGMVIGCNHEYNNGECLVCKVGKLFSNSKDKAEKDLTQYPSSILAKTSYATQVIVTEDGGKTYGAPCLLNLAPSGAEAIADANSTLENNGLPTLNDFEKGQDIIISNPPTAGKYTLMQTSVQVPLDKICPDAETTAIQDVAAELQPKLISADEQEEALRFTFPNLDWDSIMKEVRG